jgi:hypothetical protein
MHKLGRRGTLSNVDVDLAPSAVRASLEEPAGEEEENLPARPRALQSHPLLVVLMIALGGVGYGIYLKWRTSRAPASVSNGAVLTLRAERHGKALRVSWNRDTPVVNHARDAVLSIRDGDLQPKELHLDLEQLRNGTVVYSAAKDSVQFRLELRGQDGTKTSETILAGAAPKAHLTARLVAASRPSAGSSSRNRRSFRPGRAVFVDAPPQPTSFHPQAFAQIEQVAYAQPKLAGPPPAESQQNGINPREPQQPPVVPTFVGPHPIHESLPNLPPEIRATVTSEVEVQFKVQVDEYGRVVGVDLVGSTGPASDSLVKATRQAAVLWRFAPGVGGSQPVSSEVVLMFRYIPKTGGN